MRLRMRRLAPRRRIASAQAQSDLQGSFPILLRGRGERQGGTRRSAAPVGNVAAFLGGARQSLLSVEEELG